jgi:hypothetical protein
LKNIQKTKKQGFWTIVQSLCLLGSILAQELNRVICRKKIYPWGSVYIDLNKNSVLIGCVLTGTVPCNVLRIFFLSSTNSNLLHNSSKLDLCTYIDHNLICLNYKSQCLLWFKIYYLHNKARYNQIDAKYCQMVFWSVPTNPYLESVVKQNWCKSRGLCQHSTSVFILPNRDFPLWFMAGYLPKCQWRAVTIGSQIFCNLWYFNLMRWVSGKIFICKRSKSL